MKPGLRRLPALLVALLLIGAGCSDDPANNNNGDMDAGDVLVDGDDMDAGDGGHDGGDADPDADSDGGTQTDNLVVCENTLDAPPADAACGTTSGTNSFVMLQGEVLAGDTIYENGQVLIDRSSGNATIACVGCDCGDEPDAADATVVSCPSSVISPGLINAHEHLGWGAGEPKPHGDERYDHRHDWREGLRGHDEIRSGGSDYSDQAVLFGELRHLMGGATSIAGSGGADGFLRNMDRNSEGLNTSVDYETFPLGDTSGTLIAEGCGYRDIPGDSVLANGIYLPHISEGIDDEAQNEYTCLSATTGGGNDVVEDNTSVIHGIGLTAADIADFGASGAELVWSARTNIDLYGNTADVVTYDKYGVTIALGTDWVLSGSMNMLRELACVDYLNQNHYNSYFTDKHLWQMATANGAQALGVGDQVGTLAEGYVADIAIFDASDRSAYRAVLGAGVQDVQLVMRGGDAIVGQPNLIQALVDSANIGDCESVDVCGDDRLVCAQNDTGYSWSDILGAGSSYDAFYCDAPPSEPSCVPMRPDEYTGMSSATDQDGDGVDDSEDSCPTIFNPKRPLDGDTQADFDGDGIGDACDTCPLNEGETCDPFDPNDRDADGTPNDTDNCPAVANPDQADSDSDDIGDACDACPDFANAGGTGCPATIYDIWDGTVEQGAKVLIQDAIVTAAGDSGVFIQYTSDAADFDGVPYSGVYIYMPDYSPMPARGDRVDVSATVSEFGSEPQLSDPDMITVNSSGNTLPAPVVLDAASVATGGANADHVGVLIRVENLTVASAPNQYGEFEVDGGLLVDDLFYEITPAPAAGDTFNALVGVLNRGFGNTKLTPRDENDVIMGPPTIEDFGPAQAYLEAGTTDVPAPGLTVTLNRAPAQTTTVDLTYSDSTIIDGPATVDVPANQDSVQVSLYALGAAGSSADVTATLTGTSMTATVTIYDDASVREVVDLTPANQTLQLDATGTATVVLNLPAPTGGQVVDISTVGEISAPNTVTVPAGQMSADFTVTAASVAGTGILTAQIGNSAATANVDVTAGPSTPCLIIGEYVEGGSFNKGIELFNCGTTDLELSDFGVCQANGSGSECDSELILPSQSLGAGAVYTLCHPSASFSCDNSTGIINHNGNDRYVIYQDDDGSGAFEPANDTVTDAFGETAVDPGEAWKDKTYRRCDFTPYYGQTTFDVLDYYTEHAKDDVSHFGTEPTAGCP
ncbi:amidohydrolase family protein [Persicimonas caeni]|uniref:Amidohydrolase family protein n=1 Tax=Persicimonas caeni TaxID=2292766 RepID=A0A4Y6PNB8_PERCE|nr:amidohydrolase family protein [Persicimonas caeni]QED30934.1 amidohydrolase family protein [Persicimonas caeni]